MAKWFLYILKCRDGSLYTGITTDLEKRIKRHNEGCASKYTRRKRPVKIVHTEIFNTESSARRREAEIKKLSRKNKIELIQKRMIYTSKAPVCRFLGTKNCMQFLGGRSSAG